MRTLSVLLLLLAWANTSLAQTWPPPSQGESEAARLLREASEEWRELQRSVPNPETSDLWYLNGNPERVDPAEAEAFIRRMQPILAKFRKAVDSGDLRFPINYEDGWNALLPHVSHMRSMAMAMDWDVSWRLHIGQARSVADDIDRMFAVGDALKHDGVLISSLVNVAVTSLSVRSLEGAIGTGAVSPGDAEDLIERIDSITAGDAFGLIGSIEMERAMTTGWVLDRIETAEGRAEIDALFAQQMMWDGGTIAQLDIPSMTNDELRGAVMMNDAALTRASEIMAMDDPKQAQREFEKLEKEIEAGMYGPFAQATAPSFSRVASSLAMILEMLDETRGRLEIIASGEDGAKSLLNAAIWYRRAMAKWNRLPAEVREAILAAGATSRAREEAVMDDADGNADVEAPELEVSDALEQAKPIIDILIEASAIERCNFDDTRNHRHAMFPSPRDYLPGMQELAALLARSTAQRDGTDARERLDAELASAVMMVHHLPQDRLFESVEAAAEALERIEPLVRARVETGLAADSPLHRALAQLRPEDPFNSRGAMKFVTERLRLQIERSLLARGPDSLSQRMERMLHDVPRGMTKNEVEVTRQRIETIRPHEWRPMLDGLLAFLHEAADAFGTATTPEEIDAADTARTSRLDTDPGLAVLRTLADTLTAPYGPAARGRLEWQSHVESLRR